MSDRIVLSGTEDQPRVWIEDGWLVTSDEYVARQWDGRVYFEERIQRGRTGQWSVWIDDAVAKAFGSPKQWRILITDTRAVYAYVEGEPWAAEYRGHFLCGADIRSADPDAFRLARRAANVVDTAEQFRILAREVNGE